MQYIENGFTSARAFWPLNSEIFPKKKHPSGLEGCFLYFNVLYLVVVGVGLGVGVPPISFAIAMFFVVFSRAVASCVVQVSIFP